jgi:hypothetical protein
MYSCVGYLLIALVKMSAGANFLFYGCTGVCYVIGYAFFAAIVFFHYGIAVFFNGLFISTFPSSIPEVMIIATKDFPVEEWAMIYPCYL